jgi:hypothetical protein
MPLKILFQKIIEVECTYHHTHYKDKVVKASDVTSCQRKCAMDANCHTITFDFTTNNCEFFMSSNRTCYTLIGPKYPSLAKCRSIISARNFNNNKPKFGKQHRAKISKMMI